METDNERIQPIEGKIADVFIIDNQHSIVLNKGSEDGIKENMRFMIYEKGKQILDPDSKVSLGFFEYAKGKVKITQVSQKYSIAKSDEHETVVVNQLELPFFGAKTKVITKKLPIDNTDFESNIIQEKKVRIGDFVRQILSENVLDCEESEQKVQK
ncbi:hypothetical protein [Methanosarcina sp. UBA411]|jgi:hypothetical protein|uniref:hypothetical protein n=1 Tax=Methanosarcina sp. UBA411 TaxID=1915589 RepID=UPI0025D4E8D4|nr:hypothetical protein [Methanosarcina sp. UBA411]